MSTPKVIRAAQNMLRQVNRISHRLAKGLVGWLLRGLLVLGRQPFPSKAGFVLPTTVLLLLVVVLTVGAIGYRTFTRTQQAITDRQQQVVYNAATPAIDRAKSKIEFLFDPQKDTRGGGVPSQTQLLGMMLNDERDLGKGITVPHFPPDDKNVDPYTFEGEERIDVNGDGLLDNAWRYRVDLDGDGNLATSDNDDGWAVYSIVFTAPDDGAALRDARNDSNSPGIGWQKRAKELQVRNAPLSNAQQSNLVCQRNNGTSDGTPLINGQGWFPDQTNTTKIRKNFQVNAYVVPDNPNGTVATLEFQQDREATQGFKWAAWFRNDLEIYPGADFNWNGAMHTEGSLIMGGDSRFKGYLVSSSQSCINSKDASEITSKENEKDKPINGTPAFKGRFIAGTIRDNNFSGKATFDIPTGGEKPASVVMEARNDSIAPGSLKPVDFSLEPVTLQTKGQSEARNPDAVPTAYEDGGWKGTEFNKDGTGRLYSIREMVMPYVDDTFRADNRWGPKPTWGQKGLPIGVTSESSAGGTSTAKIGEPITGVLELTGSDPAPGTDSASVGLDGYWERRARVDGLRLIVGQRLELGDPAGWGGPGNSSSSSIRVENEPLRPWTEGCAAGDRCNEERQRRDLWDNLAAVQATAVYHNATDTTAETRDFPDACLVTTIHPGTATTLDRSATFENLAYGLPPTAIPGYTNQPSPLVISDFFRGRGTNGWEYSTPTAADFSNTDSNLMKALRNLAYFAGDPNGGAPSFKPFQDRTVHPYPSMAMWGDFSNLRQVFKLLDGGTSYDKLSPADKTTLHTAGCTLGMLAYNLDYLEKLKVYDLTATNDPTKNGTIPRSLAGHTDTEINASGITLTNAVLADPKYSEGLRGRIRVIEHIARGYINTTNATNIPVNQRPPNNFINSLKDINTNTGMDLMVWDPRKSNNPETYVRLLERWRDDSGTSATQKDELNKIISFAQLIITKEQVARDRTWGFGGSYGNNPYSDSTLVSTGPLGDCGFKIDDANKSPLGGWLLEDPVPAFSATVLATGTTETLANLPEIMTRPDPLSRLCSARPRYPILYSLFPAKINAVIPPATVAAGYGGSFLPHKDISDALERNVARDPEDSLNKFARYITNENGGATYEVVSPASIALRPLTLSQTGVTLGGTKNWVLPYAAGTPGTGATPNNNQFNLIKICATKCSDPANANSTASFQTPKNGTLVRVALKDSVFYNGREMMPVRALNLDLDLMRRSSHKDDLWLPQKGIIYAFREDATSESQLVRPATTTWESCDTDAELKSTTCAMKTADASAYDSKDPPINDENFITPKPVDYFPDPDRRPYGFRLLQGANLKRDGDEGRGLSLISDNPVYIQGDFNLHQDGGGEGLEEFTQPLAENYSNFYDRTELDLSFADRNKDQWRPSEIVADAVTLLSSNFCDGSIEDGLTNIGSSSLPKRLQGRYGCASSTTRTSYHAQNRPKTKVDNDATKRGVLWVRTNLIDSYPEGLRPTTTLYENLDEGESPILVSRAGKPVHWNNAVGATTAYAGDYIETKTTRASSLVTAASNRMNMIMVSGLVPSREGQSYGGLHNFPRFIENWKSKKLYISGAFLQLNFSSYATAPFDQEAWQPGAADPTTGDDEANQWIRYYEPPDRRWGYDVGLQYAPAGPVAQRFQFAEDIRSEFYSEPPANDPYIRNLCLRVPGNAEKCPT